MHSNSLHEQNLKSALFQIGAYSRKRIYWACTDKDITTMRAAQKYADDHPNFLQASGETFQIKGLEFCGARVNP